MIQRGLNWLHSQVAIHLQDFALNILAAGPIPKHVAFVMDGNRRYARINNKAVQQGHRDGFLALRHMLEICFKLQIRCVSAYVFAIENFKRTEEEVSTLMKLAEEKLIELSEHGELLDEYGVRLNVVGNVELLPPAVQKAVRKAEDATRHNKRFILNLCMSYASRHEITSAVEKSIHNAIEDGTIDSITEETIDSQLMTTLGGSPPLDILIRTSGVKRLSDFFLWQCCENTQLQFTSTYWPDFGLLDFIPIVLDYQRKIFSQPSSP